MKNTTKILLVVLLAVLCISPLAFADQCQAKTIRTATSAAKSRCMRTPNVDRRSYLHRPSALVETGDKGVGASTLAEAPAV